MTGKIKKLIFLINLFIFVVVGGFGQTHNESADTFRFSKSNFKLMASGIVFNGVKCEFKRDILNQTKNLKSFIKTGNNIFYQPDWNGPDEDGLRLQRINPRTCTRYSMVDLAESAGWFKRTKDDNPMIGRFSGLRRIGNKLWIGSAFGLIVFDTKSKRWSRFAVKEKVNQVINTSLIFGDNDYLFMRGGSPPSLIIYSVKENKWLELKSIPRKAFVEFGYTGGGSQEPGSLPRNDVSLPVDHRFYASKPNMLMKDFFLSEISSATDGNTFIFENSFGTIFKMTKTELRKSF